MGFSLRPGHFPDNGKDGWKVERYEEILGGIDVGALSLGNWGSSVENGVDSHSPLYSIPNPWSAAYLYQYVLGDTTHPLVENLSLLLLDLLLRVCVYNEFEIVEVKRPNEGEFKRLWDLAPDFLKFNSSQSNIESMWFFRAWRDPRSIVGGLSKSSLVWVSQHYSQTNKREELLQNDALSTIMNSAKDAGYPFLGPQERNNFWAQTIFNKLLKDKTELAFEGIVEKAPVGWLGKITKGDPRSSPYYHDDIECIVIPASVIDEQKRILNIDNPPGFLDLLKLEKCGEKLPMGMGNIRWVIFDTLFEKSLVSQAWLANADPALRTQSIENQYLYPLKSEAIEKYKIVPKDLKLSKVTRLGNVNQGALDISWRGKASIHLNNTIATDKRRIAIWPPFSSEVTPTFVAEFDPDGVRDSPELKFFSRSGESIPAQVFKYPEDDFRIYRLNRKSEFPAFVQLSVSNGGSGLLPVQERKKASEHGRIIAGIDFGTNHSAIAWMRNESIEVLDFSRSAPLFLPAEGDERLQLQYNFLPPPFGQRPTSKNTYDEARPWQAFRSIWLDFAAGYEEDECIKDGIIPFLTNHPKFTAGENTATDIKRDLKWGADEQINRYRNLYLRQLVLMTKVEAEAYGCDDLEIRWSYPMAFTTYQLNQLEIFWHSADLA